MANNDLFPHLTNDELYKLYVRDYTFYRDCLISGFAFNDLKYMADVTNCGVDDRQYECLIIKRKYRRCALQSGVCSKEYLLSFKSATDPDILKIYAFIYWDKAIRDFNTLSFNDYNILKERRRVAGIE
jgi:hypothetical protein